MKMKELTELELIMLDGILRLERARHEDMAKILFTIYPSANASEYHRHKRLIDQIDWLLDMSHIFIDWTYETLHEVIADLPEDYFDPKFIMESMFVKE